LDWKGGDAVFPERKREETFLVFKERGAYTQKGGGPGKKKHPFAESCSTSVLKRREKKEAEEAGKRKAAGPVSEREDGRCWSTQRGRGGKRGAITRTEGKRRFLLVEKKTRCRAGKGKRGRESAREPPSLGAGEERGSLRLQEGKMGAAGEKGGNSISPRERGRGNSVFPSDGARGLPRSTAGGRKRRKSVFQGGNSIWWQPRGGSSTIRKKGGELGAHAEEEGGFREKRATLEGGGKGARGVESF